MDHMPGSSKSANKKGSKGKSKAAKKKLEENTSP